jgi:hypothetical protein
MLQLNLGLRRHKSLMMMPLYHRRYSESAAFDYCISFVKKYDTGYKLFFENGLAYIVFYLFFHNVQIVILLDCSYHLRFVLISSQSDHSI